METIVGVFASRERAEETVAQLLDHRVLQDAIVFLTRSETEAMTLGKSLGVYAGAFVGGAAGLTAGIVAATLFVIPGIGQVFALGVGASAALGLAGAKVGKELSAKPNLSLMDRLEAPLPTSDDKSAEDLAFFGRVLNDGRSLIIVRTTNQETAKVASGILDRMSITAQWRMSGRMQTALRQIGGISIVDVKGRITVGEGNIMLREVVNGLLLEGSNRILLDLGGVEYIDSSGIGELVKTHTTLKNQGGQLKIVNLNRKVLDLLKATRLHEVFDLHRDEASAVHSFGVVGYRATA
jgi:anti-sigma B factor antagonist